MAYATVSIHAPVKSATVGEQVTVTNNLVSIHAPVKSATSRTSGASLRYARFNPRARKERDDKTLKTATDEHCFNPRARKERDSWR